MNREVPAPFYVHVRAEGHLINAWMVPAAHVVEEAKLAGLAEHATPVLIASISGRVCDETGGRSGPIFTRWLELVKESIQVMCRSTFGQHVEVTATESFNIGQEGNA